MLIGLLRFSRAALLLLFPLAVLAQAEVDLPGAKDHPLLQRFSGSWLVGYQQQAFEQTLWAASARVKDWDHLSDVTAFEGRVTRLSYLSPKGKSPLEVHRNHTQALQAAGFGALWTCERDCDKLFWTWQRHLKPQESLSYLDASTSTAKGSRYNVSRPLTGGAQVRFWTGRLAQADGSAVIVQVVSSPAVNELTERTATWVQILEPKPMQTGQVVVNATALQGGLAAQGHVVVGGLLFDTGKATLRSESQPQLDELAALLKSQPQWKVYIVGHTDNVGSLEANLALSQARAESVVAALQRQGIAPARVLARGVASLAPKASNADEAGRAKNRRVELVLQ
jgi:outer membrane protein OmpA-like peptidoglycan-associated protein